VKPHPAVAGLLLALTLTGCAGLAGSFPTGGYQDIAAEEAAWRQVEKRLVGMPVERVEACAGQPQIVNPAPGQTVLTYHAEDLKNYCRVALGVIHGRISSVASDYSAPEFMWLRDGSNYCGRIFIGCAR
jgi:hypothetical protein